MRRKLLAGIIFPPLAALAVTAYWWRPSADHGDPNEPIRNRGTMSQYNPMELDIAKEPAILTTARKAVVFVQANIGRFFMMHLGNFRIIQDEHYKTFVTSVCERPPGIPLITVSNHRSFVDDIFLFSCLLPYRLNVQPRYLRWTVCSQEYCFKVDTQTYNCCKLFILLVYD